MNAEFDKIKEELLTHSYDIWKLLQKCNIKPDKYQREADVVWVIISLVEYVSSQPMEGKDKIVADMFGLFLEYYPLDKHYRLYLRLHVASNLNCDDSFASVNDKIQSLLAMNDELKLRNIELRGNNKELEGRIGELEFTLADAIKRLQGILDKA